MITFKQLEQACDTTLKLRRNSSNSPSVRQLVAVLSRCPDFDRTIPGAIRCLTRSGFKFGDAKPRATVPVETRAWKLRLKSLRRMRGALLVGAVALLSVGCGSPEQAVEVKGSDATVHDVPIYTQSGVDFSCFSHNRRVYCKRDGTALHPGLAALIPSNEFTVVAESRTGITGLEVWNDTICIGAAVVARPLSRTFGEATYCFGEASLDAQSVADLDGVSPFDLTANGSEGLTLGAVPLVGADVSLEFWTRQTLFAPVVTDGETSTSGISENCKLKNQTLTCSNFETEIIL